MTESTASTNARKLRPGRLWRTRSRSHEVPLLGGSPLAEASIARDIEDEEDPNPDQPIEDFDTEDDGSDSEISTLRPTVSANSVSHSMAGSYRKPNFTNAGSRATTLPGSSTSKRYPTKAERREARREERSLLRDNNVIPPKHPQKGDSSHSISSQLSRRLSKVGIPGGDRKVVGPDEEEALEAAHTVTSNLSETTPLIGNPELPYGGHDTPEMLNKKWEEAVAAGDIRTTWQREAKVLSRYAAPLMITFFLQYSLTIASIVTVGHLGIAELGACSLASMTASITGYAVYQGLATSLDTLCSQAYGSGRLVKKSDDRNLSKRSGKLTS